MTALYSAHRLSANAEASGDVLLNFAPLDGLKNGRVPRSPSLVALAPRVNANQGFIGNLALDAQVGPRDGEHLLNLRCVEEDQRESFSPVRLLLLGPDGAEPEPLLDLLKNGPMAVSENDARAFAAPLDVPLAIKEARQVTRENVVREARNGHAIAYRASVTVNVAHAIANSIREALS